MLRLIAYWRVRCNRCSQPLRMGLSAWRDMATSHKARCTMASDSSTRPERASPEEAISLHQQPHMSGGILERIMLQMASSLDLEAVLTTITQGLVEDLDAAFARIWLLGPGDLCDSCYQADNCDNRSRCLHLKASAGL